MNFLGNFRFASNLKTDLFASLSGSAWTMLVQLACVPLYIKFLGIEAYGLVGFYLMLQAMLQVLDFGLSPTMNREMARYSVQPEKSDEARDLVRTLELGYWLIGIVVGIVLVAASPWIASHWFKAGKLPLRSIAQAVALMGVVAMLQWPVSFYQGGLMGLRKQVLFNSLRIIAATLSNGGAVLILWLVSPTIQAFFSWLVLTNAVMVACWTTFLWKNLPPATREARFDVRLVRNIGPFAAGMSGIAVFSLILGQADKIVLSRVFSLSVFGYYTVAGMFGAGLVTIVSAVFNAVYPQFSALVALGDEAAITRLYHKATQLMLLLIVPLTAVLALFPVEVLQLWTHSPDVAQHAGTIAAVLVLAAALNGLMYLPFTLQLAYGWTSIGLKITIFLTLIVVPSIWFAATRYGPVGAAFVVVGLQAVNMFVGVPLTHRRLLPREMAKWILQDITPPLSATMIVVGVARILIVGQMSALNTLVALCFVLLLALTAAASFAPQIRMILLTKLSNT